ARPVAPRSPYTTLADLQPDGERLHLGGGGGERGARSQTAHDVPVVRGARVRLRRLVHRDPHVGSGREVEAVSDGAHEADAIPSQDRKSTRLNSSHVKIS